MSKYSDVKPLHKFTSIHALIYNHFNQERKLYSRKNFKLNRSTALAEWQEPFAA